MFLIVADITLGEKILLEIFSQLLSVGSWVDGTFVVIRQEEAIVLLKENR